ncbi:alpha/beta fold hydrolase [Thalassovita sp.]|uniref:alpha/beta fold hydrolase n=1 Tax=Thalassovita sp. TaxID=1979401 RepID=UPI0029DE8F76|nr:alpha/beta fold hydrolase [Thalassovita sp.]
MQAIIWAALAVLAVVATWLGWNIGLTRRTARKVEQAVPPRGKFLTVSTGRLHYIDKGQGPVVLMIHGLGAQLGNFDMGLADDLARDHRVIAIDRPGMGWSDRPDDADASPRAQAAVVAEVIDKLKLERPLVVGHSLGGAIALCLALDFPEKIRGLALLAPLTGIPKEPAPPFVGLNIPSDRKRWFLSETLAIPASIKAAEDVFHYIFGPNPVPRDYSVRGGGLLGLRPVSFRNTSRDFLASGRNLKWMGENYANLQVPVHILYGRDDRILDPVEHGEKLATRHQFIQLHTVDGGHMLPLTHQDQAAAFIRQADPA